MSQRTDYNEQLQSAVVTPRSFTPGQMIRILIADDHAIVRAGLKQFIADQLDMEVAGEAATGSETIALVRSQEFDIVLLDISMPDKNGIDTLKSQGMTVVTDVDKASFRSKLDGLYAEFAKTFGQERLDAIAATK